MYIITSHLYYYYYPASPTGLTSSSSTRALRCFAYTYTIVLCIIYDFHIILIICDYYDMNIFCDNTSYDYHL